MKRISLLTIVAISFVLCCCTAPEVSRDDIDKIYASGISIVLSEQNDIEIAGGETKTINYEIRGTSGAPKVSLASVNGWIASIHKSSDITGTIEVTAPDKYIEGTVTILVSEGPNTVMEVLTFNNVAVTSVSLDRTSALLVEGEILPLTATLNPNNATDKSVTWSSSNTAVVTVDQNGVISAMRAGNAIITVKTNDGSEMATCRVTVIATVKGVSLDKTDMSMDIYDSEYIFATLTPSNASEKGVIWSSSDMSVATVDHNGKVNAVEEGTATITVITVDGGYTASCEVTVTDPYACSGYENGYAYVDLGLCVKWASFNVGATNPEESGDYFSWGEINKKSDYRWSHYKWCHGTHEIITKYCTQSSYGTVDNKTVLEQDDDVAHVKWNGTWRMPTEQEWQELIENCTWIWEAKNGVDGYKVTSKKTGYTSRSIFLPAAGYYYDYMRFYVGAIGHYWSSSLNTGDSSGACYLNFRHDSNDKRMLSYDRCYGQSIRPVSE